MDIQKEVMAKQGKIFFRADGHSAMGLGHVVRSLALAEMLRADFEVHFMTRTPLPFLRQQILEVCESVIELPAVEDDLLEAQHLLENHLTGTEIVVLDGYHFNTEYQRLIKKKENKLVCIDDIHAYHFVADVVINHAGGVSETEYSAEPYTQFYLGLKYALLRKPFREAAKNRDYPARERNSLFICLGGADPKNDTLSVLRKCEQLNNLRKCYVVVGAAYQFKNEMEAYLKTTSLDIELLTNLSAENMVYYMKKCGAAITSPSSVSLEYLSVGGCLYLKLIADNQKRIAQYYLESGFAAQFDIANGELVHFKKSNEVNQLLDGNQNIKYAKIFKSLIH